MVFCKTFLRVDKILNFWTLITFTIGARTNHAHVNFTDTGPFTHIWVALFHYLASQMALSLFIILLILISLVLNHILLITGLTWHMEKQWNRLLLAARLEPPRLPNHGWQLYHGCAPQHCSELSLRKRRHTNHQRGSLRSRTPSTPEVLKMQPILTVRDSNTQAFTLFSRLPAELRLAIWEYAAFKEPRIIDDVVIFGD